MPTYTPIMTNIIWFVLLPFSVGEIAYHSRQLLILIVGCCVMFAVLYRDRLPPHYREIAFSLFSFLLGVFL